MLWADAAEDMMRSPTLLADLKPPPEQPREETYARVRQTLDDALAELEREITLEERIDVKRER